MNKQQQLQKLVDLYRLRQFYILKDNIGMEFSNMHFNKPARKIEHDMKLILKDNINSFVDGTGLQYDPQEMFDGIIQEALQQQKNTLIKNPNKITNQEVKDTMKAYNRIFENSYNRELNRLWDLMEETTLDNMMKGYKEEELKKTTYDNVLKKTKSISNVQNVIRDALHTNQCLLSFNKAINDGYRYKIWMNGRIIGIGGGNKKNKKSRTRPWHISKEIAPVLMEDYFEIKHSQCSGNMMYPGDLNGGACNVANCRCWLYYTNRSPEGYKKKGTYNIKNKNNFRVNNSTSTKPKLKTRISKKYTEISTHLRSQIKKPILNKKLKKFTDYVGELRKDKTSTMNYLKSKMPIPKKMELVEKMVIKSWARDDSFINLFFNSEFKEGMSDKLKEEYIKRIELLNSVIDKYNNIYEDLHLHRFVKGDFGLVDVGKEGVFDKFTASSFDALSKYGRGDPFHIHILTPKGSKALYIEDILNKFATGDHDNEVLFPPGTKYKTLSIDYKTKEAYILIL